MADQSTTNDEAKGRLSDAAFDLCFEQFSAGIRAWLRSKLGNEADVEDCFSRVFEKLWTHGESVRPAARGAWLFVVARREAALQWRKQKRGESVLETFASEIRAPSGCLSPEESLLKTESIQRLKQAAESLSDDQREVLQRRFQDDLSFREIADELQIPLGTALTRLHTALKRLRKILNDQDDESTSPPKR